MDGLAEDESCRFRQPKSVQEEDSLLVQSKPKSTRYKDKWAVEVFSTWQAAREPKFCTLDAGSVFKDYDVHRVQSLEEKLEDLDSPSLNYWLRGTQRQFSENICSEDDLRSRIFGTFVVKFLACLPLLGFSNI